MKKILILFLILSVSYNQNMSDLFSMESDQNKQTQNEQNFDITKLEKLTYTPVEKPIDPDTYILGPGDLLGINIISAQNISLPLRINPVGEILIPSVGIVKVSGLTLTESKKIISNYIKEDAISNAIVDITLLDLRHFKIQLLGAVNNPGFVIINPTNNIQEIITKNGGTLKYAHPDYVQIIRDGEKIELNLSKYLSEIDLSQNINLMEGDIIFVPFNDFALDQNYDDISHINNQVTIYGFISKSSSGNTFRYFPGYTVRDYIALAGGTIGNNTSFKIGNSNRAKILRADGTFLSNAINEVVQPGDIIEIPPTFMSQIVGNDGLIRTLSSVISSAYLIYRYVEDQK